MEERVDLRGDGWVAEREVEESAEEGEEGEGEEGLADWAMLRVSVGVGSIDCRRDGVSMRLRLPSRGERAVEEGRNGEEVFPVDGLGAVEER